MFGGTYKLRLIYQMPKWRNKLNESLWFLPNSVYLHRGPYRKPISILFKTILLGFTKLLVLGGQNSEYSDVAEIIDLDAPNKNCENLHNFPYAVKMPTGGLLSNGSPVICGGALYGSTPVNECFSYFNNSWSAFPSMALPRFISAVSASPYPNGSHRFLVTGGIGGLNSGEVLTDIGWQNLTTHLPTSIYGHCMVHINSTTAVIIGGTQNQIYSTPYTYFFNSEHELWFPGPSLKGGRNWSSCGKISKDNNSHEFSVIVVGGINNIKRLASAEILDEGSSEWRKGPDYPFGISSPSLIEYPGGGVILVGGDSDFSTENKIYYLEHANSTWVEMPQKLKVGRESAIAFLVPDEITNCS